MASITGGTDIAFHRIRFKTNQGDGIVISASGNVSLEDCSFANSNHAALTAYDIDITQSSGNTWVKHCRCESAIGAGGVTNAANDTNHKGYFFGTSFIGGNTSPTTVFSSGTPQMVRDCPGYNPRGSISAPAIGASPFTTNTSQNDVNIIFTALNGITAFKIGGTGLGVPGAHVAYHVSARQSVEVDRATTAPTWIWIAD